VSIDGTPIDRFDAETWRRQVAWVSQDPAILAGTIADNIRLGRPDATLAEVRSAAESARAVGFVDELPDGFDTVLGEHGLRLSGGQRQRLAIARAILRDAPVVVLDEFTAHLDDDTEADVVAATTALLAGRTALIVAHRPRTIAIADRVVALDAGRADAPASPPAPAAPALPDAPASLPAPAAPAMRVRS
jgi:ABC-type multidrug transport system fused ATPase/permease subunit